MVGHMLSSAIRSSMLPMCSLLKVLDRCDGALAAAAAAAADDDEDCSAGVARLTGALAAATLDTGGGVADCDEFTLFSSRLREKAVGGGDGKKQFWD